MLKKTPPIAEVSSTIDAFMRKLAPDLLVEIPGKTNEMFKGAVESNKTSFMSVASGTSVPLAFVKFA